MDPARPSLVSFYCACGTPLSAPLGTASIVCHACGQPQTVPTVMAAPMAVGIDPEVARRRRTRGVIALVFGGVGVIAKVASPHTVVTSSMGGTYVSDGPMDTALTGLAVLGAGLILYGLYLLVTAPPRA